MVQFPAKYTFLVLVAVLLIIGGSGVWVWNQQDVRACHEKYDNDPDVAVDCEDQLTGILHYGSMFSVAIGVITIAVSRYARLKAYVSTRT